MGKYYIYVMYEYEKQGFHTHFESFNYKKVLLIFDNWKQNKFVSGKGFKLHQVKIVKKSIFKRIELLNLCNNMWECK